jgi:hypothetical protein
MPYDDPKFGVIERRWLSLPVKVGGHSAAGITWNETEGTKVTRIYFKGPVKLQKFGALVLSTIGKGEQLFRLTKQGIAGTLLDRLVCSTTATQYSIASKALDDEIDAGSYLTIFGSTNVCSTGSVAFFIDYRRSYDATKHDPVA